MPLSAFLRTVQGGVRTARAASSLMTRSMFSNSSKNPLRLEEQQRSMVAKGVDAQICEIPEGTKLVGLNVHAAPTREELSLGHPMYSHDSLLRLTEPEQAFIDGLKKKYHAKSVQFTVWAKMKCLVAKSSAGETVFYVHPEQVTMNP